MTIVTIEVAFTIVALEMLVLILEREERDQGFIRQQGMRLQLNVDMSRFPGGGCWSSEDVRWLF